MSPFVGTPSVRNVIVSGVAQVRRVGSAPMSSAAFASCGSSLRGKRPHEVAAAWMFSASLTGLT
jgi:hypothetical protein